MRTKGAAGERGGGSCESCPAYRAGNLERLGIDAVGHDYVVALAGNPNTGKSTVFNLLTGLRQHTGNWPGKTVTRAEGAFRYGGKGYKLVDLPGTYSLLAASPDEEVARDFLLFGCPDVTLAVVDATRLERNLNLILQIIQITPRVVICLNLIDQARRQGLEVDDRRLAQDLGVPVVPMAARYREGLGALLQAVNEVATGAVACRGYQFRGEPPELKRGIDTLVDRLEREFPGLPNAHWVALRLLDGDERIMAAVRTGELRGLGAELSGMSRRAQSAEPGVMP